MKEKEEKKGGETRKRKEKRGRGFGRDSDVLLSRILRKAGVDPQVHFYGEWRYDFCQDPFYDGNKPWNAPQSTNGSKYNYLPVRGDDPGFCGKPVILAEVQVRSPPFFLTDEITITKPKQLDNRPLSRALLAFLDD